MQEPDATASRRQAVWTRHWATGAAHSCAGSYTDTYGGAIAGFWAELHAGTAAGARVLDIATGSGALPRLLLNLRPALDLRIDAVDLAEPAAAWLRSLPAAQAARVHFHAGIGAEHLPFADGAFDLVLSQYGLEYADMALASAELLRVRAPRGRIGLVMHDVESRPVRLAAVEIAHIDWLRGPVGLLTACASMLAPMALAATPEGRARLAGDPAADAARERFNAAQDGLAARARVAPDGADVLGEVQDAVAQLLGLAARQGEAVARRAWQALDLALDDARWRLQELRACALDAAAAAAVREQLAAAGLSVHLQPLDEGAHRMGWALRAGC
jgi:SAM-dependent methyltransferase